MPANDLREVLSILDQLIEAVEWLAAEKPEKAYWYAQQARKQLDKAVEKL